MQSGSSGTLVINHICGENIFFHFFSSLFPPTMRSKKFHDNNCSLRVDKVAKRVKNEKLIKIAKRMKNGKRKLINGHEKLSGKMIS